MTVNKITSKQPNPFEKLEELKTINVCDEKALKNLYENVLGLNIFDEASFLEFLRQRDVIDMHIVNEIAESYFLNSIDVSDEVYKKRKDHFEQVISPITREYEEKMNRKFLDSDVGKKIGKPYDILRRNQQAASDLFREENLELHKQIDQISSQMTEIQGRALAEWNGEKIPVPKVYPFLESLDRSERKRAYESINAAKLSTCEEIDNLFDKLLGLRQQVAVNAGFKTYTPFRFKELQRFDWDESHCFAFHQAVKKKILPLRDKLLQKRKKLLKLESLKPYDLNVDMYGREPLKIYQPGQSEELIEGVGKIIKAIDGELFNYFCEIRKNKLLDLEARENKAPGGYMVMYPIFEQASVFYNGAGLGDDLMVVLHELGHCFHYFLGKNIRPFALQSWTSEVAEAGSMSMEFIGLEKMGEYLDGESCQRLKQDRLMSIVDLFIGCAKWDEFQHWLYAHPGHSSLERRGKWAELNLTYSGEVDFRDYEEPLSKTQWQFLHILHLPFYYIDYAISELLALSIWDRYKKDPSDGIAHYKRGCAAGASDSVREIYKMFGTTLSFGEDVIAPLATRLEQELHLS